jgi:energy-coupling factor transporter ATP-binding protein EcfA2
VEEIRQRVDASLEAVRLRGFERRQPANLSGGEKQRLAIASVLAMRPRLLVMDEPTTDLDPMGKAGVLSVAADIRAQTHGGMLVVDHDPEEARRADRVVVLSQGRVAAAGNPRDVLGDVEGLEQASVMPPQTARLFALLGSARRPLDVDEALKDLRNEGWSVSDDRCEKLRHSKRSQAYGDPLVEIEHLGHVYPGGIAALRDVTVEIRQREFIAILGQNGGGKSAFVKHFNGLLRPTAGRAVVKGMDTRDTGVHELGRVVGYVFQNPDHQIFAETVHDEVAFGPRLFGVSREETEIRVDEALESVDLAEKREADPFMLTKGERERVAVASVLAAKPELIILDEPTTGLDYREIRSMMALVNRLNEAGHTIVVITHAMWVAAEYAHRTIVIGGGEILADGATREIFVLEKAFLQPPPIVTLGKRLGKTFLSVEEAAQVLQR